jgi:hypothetical protein
LKNSPLKKDQDATSVIDMAVILMSSADFNNGTILVENSKMEHKPLPNKLKTKIKAN